MIVYLRSYRLKNNLSNMQLAIMELIM